jgi:hypothetical protein
MESIFSRHSLNFIFDKCFYSIKIASNCILLSSWHFDGAATEICSQIRAQLADLGTPIGGYDVQIAATALGNNLILVTHNVDEFSRVERLQIEDWEAEE